MLLKSWADAGGKCWKPEGGLQTVTAGTQQFLFSHISTQEGELLGLAIEV